MKPALKLNPQCNIHLALDSGAFSIFNRYIATRGAMREHDTSYMDTKDFKKYRDGYVQFVLEHAGRFEFSVSIDIIQNPSASYDIWRELLRQGARTIPVLHYGEDMSWAKKYMDDTDYLGVGGLAYGGRTNFMSWGRKLLKLITNKHGQPKWKTHGFAVTSFDLMQIFPWTSVDSTSPLQLSRYGKLCVPRSLSKAEPATYAKEYGVVCVTDRLSKERSSYWNASTSWKKRIDDFLATFGMTHESVAASYVQRDIANVFFYLRTAQEITKARDCGPLNLYVSGKPGSGEDKFVASLPLLAERGIPDFHYLGTYALPEPVKYFLRNGYHNGHRPITIRTKARPTLHRRN